MVISCDLWILNTSTCLLTFWLTAWSDPSLHQHETGVSWPFHPDRSLNSFSLTFTIVQSCNRDRPSFHSLLFFLPLSFCFFFPIFPLPFSLCFPSLQLASPYFTIDRYRCPHHDFVCPVCVTLIPLVWILPPDGAFCWRRLKGLRLQIKFRLSGKDGVHFGFLLGLRTRHRLLLRSVCYCRDGGRTRKNETGFLSGRLGGASLPLLQSPSPSAFPSSCIKQPPPFRSALVTSTEDRHCPTLLVTWSPTWRPSRCKQNVC